MTAHFTGPSVRTNNTARTPITTIALSSPGGGRRGDFLRGGDGAFRFFSRTREKRVVEWARARKIPHIFALAGGYKWGGLTLQQVAELHLETVKAFAA